MDFCLEVRIKRFAAKQNAEFVSAKAGNKHVRPPRQNARRGHPQRIVANRMAILVVQVFETVEINVGQDGRFAAGNRSIDGFKEHAAIAEARKRIGIRKPSSFPLCFPADGNLMVQFVDEADVEREKRSQNS